MLSRIDMPVVVKERTTLQHIASQKANPRFPVLEK